MWINLSQVRDGAAIPCFLEECLIPLCRTGQQLQVIMKLLELSNNVGTCVAHEKILPSLVGLASEYPGFAFPIIFDKGTIERMVLVRASYYQQMLEKIESILTKFDFSSRQVIFFLGILFSYDLICAVILSFKMVVQQSPCIVFLFMYVYIYTHIYYNMYKI